MPAIVNICFHGIGTPARQMEPGEDRYWISHDLFREVLDEVAGRPEVRLSFDDGNASDIELGLPGLEERGLRATFFVLAARFGGGGSLSEDDVRALRDRGMAIGSHGMHHVPWRGLDERAAREEMVEARDRIADVVGRPVDRAALPLGRYDRRALGRLRAAGYREVSTSDRRRARDGAWLQPRYSVTREDTIASLRTHVLVPPPLTERLSREVVGLVKRWR
jgi:peptidoglycan/xylan/chitin deacetylase (PgdA/CDA1 family)